MMRSVRLAVLGGLAWLVYGSVAAATEFPVLLRRVPSDVNVLVLVDIDRVFDSALAKELDWKKNIADDYSRRPLLLPPGAHKLIRAMSIDINSQSTAFEVTLLEMPKGVALAKVAQKQQGYVEKIGGVDVAWIPKGAYAIKLADDLFGVLFPANRQFLSRWVREKNGQVSSYLSNAARDLKPKGPQLVIAVDLEDAVDPSTLEEKLSDLLSPGVSPGDAEMIGKVLSGVRGAKFAVKFDKEAVGIITVNFDREVAPLKPIAKPLLLKVLGNHGLTLDEVEDWNVVLEGREVVCGGPLTRSGLMRLSSLLELPSDLIPDAEEGTDAENPALYATQAHFKAVQALLNDLFSKKKQSFGQYAQWADQYARKIDRLPLLNVDKEMQEYSARISELLRQGAEAFKGVGIRSAGRQKQVWNSGYVSYGYYGYRTYDAGGQEKRAIRGEEKAKGAMDAAEMQRQIESESAAIRKVMVERYKVEF